MSCRNRVGIKRGCKVLSRYLLASFGFDAAVNEPARLAFLSFDSFLIPENTNKYEKYIQSIRAIFDGRWSAGGVSFWAASCAATRTLRKTRGRPRPFLPAAQIGTEYVCLLALFKEDNQNTHAPVGASGRGRIFSSTWSKFNYNNSH